MEISKKLKQRFCKDCNIPINLFDEPYFLERIQLFDLLYDTVPKYELFLKSALSYSNEQEYFEDYNSVKDRAINWVKSSPAYESFNKEDMNKFSITQEFKKLPSSAIYHPGNNNHKFVSVDMRKANFTALRNYNPDIFYGKETWEDFLRLFTVNQHIINSKYIRQVILGNCNPSRHISYEKFLMYKEVEKLPLKDERLSIDRIVMFSNDEVVYDVTDLSDDEVAEIIKNLGDSGTLKYSSFTLADLNGFAYAKIDPIGRIELKCAENEFLPMLIRKLLCEEPHESDLYFPFKGEIARFEKVPDKLNTITL